MIRRVVIDDCPHGLVFVPCIFFNSLSTIFVIRQVLLLSRSRWLLLFLRVTSLWHLLRKGVPMGRCSYGPVNAIISSTYPTGRSYNPTLSTSHLPINASATIQTISGQSVTGHFAGETCTLQSATSTQSFTYNASGSSMCDYSPLPLNLLHCIQSF